MEATIARIESKLDQLIGWQKDVVSEIRGMQNTLDELRTTTETLMDEQQQLRSENCEMRRQLELNEIEIDKLKQETLRKTLEISNVPVTEEEDLFGIVAQICLGISVTLDRSQVKEIFRAPTYQSQKSQIPPPIQVKLSSKEKRDGMLRKKKEKKELTTAILNMATDKPANIYINEMLTKRNRYLFKLARGLRRSNNIKFAWFKDGRLLVRKTEKAKIAAETAYGVDSFMELLDTFLTARSNRPTIVVGDFNLDLLTTTHAVQRYTNIVLSNGFFFCGNRPTRYEACLDHVLTNNSELLISVQQLQYNLFDHDAMFIEVDRPIELSPSTEAYYLKVDTSKFREFLLHNPTHTNELLAVEDNYNSLLSQLLDSIVNVVNSSIRQSQVPSALKISKVVAIPKTLTAKTFNDYRPINIPSVTDKVLQKVVNKQLIDYLEEHTLLSPHQYGFRSRSNTQTALFDVVVEIQTHCDRKEKVSAVFLDLSKAFDTCDKRVLLRRLSELGVIGESLQWFASFLDRRQQYVSDDGVDSELQVVDYGVVQGSIIGPTLFNCYVNNLKAAQWNSLHVRR
ncbi:hypothetical protein quinque_002400 [Culex quinquefasciatus]